MNAAWIKYLPKFIRGKLKSRHGLQAILSIPVKTAFTWEWIDAKNREFRLRPHYLTTT